VLNSNILSAWENENVFDDFKNILKNQNSQKKVFFALSDVSKGVFKKKIYINFGNQFIEKIFIFE
jgi:hypothetical protein